MNILEVQERLKDLGFYKGDLDGVKGAATDKAIVAFKESIGFRARPYLGPLTIEALLSTPAGPNIPWMQEAVSVRDLHEVRDRAVLSKWFDKSVSWIDPREVPWCGAFVATCLRKYNPNLVLPDNPLGARGWSKFGKSAHPGLGSILVFWRVSPNSWQGHVGFYYAEDDTHFHVLGGNQSNAVTVSRIAKNRLIASRWPSDYASIPRPVRVTSSGVLTSMNEA